jgi:CHAD domain-containing protein
LGKKHFEEYDKLFRSSGKIFSGVRDASVLIVTFDRLMEHFHQRQSRTALKTIRGELLKRRRKLLEESSGAMDRAKMIKRLREAKRDCEKWKLKEDGWAAVRSGLRRTYSNGRKAFKSADRDPADEKLHEWRKRTKDLCHELQLLKECWPQELQTMAEEAHQLADWLGEDHDLAMLREALGDEQAGLVEEFVQTRRKRLQAEAMALGSRLFSRKPAVFVRQIHDFWKLWRENPVILTLQAGGSNF